MVKLSNVIPMITVELPSLKWSKIVMKKWLTVAEQQEIGDKYPSIYTNATSTDWLKWSIEMLAKCILDWNLEDDDGKIYEITVDNIKKLPWVDFQFLIEHLAPEKKNS